MIMQTMAAQAALFVSETGEHAAAGHHGPSDAEIQLLMLFAIGIVGYFVSKTLRLQSLLGLLLVGGIASYVGRNYDVPYLSDFIEAGQTEWVSLFKAFALAAIIGYVGLESNPKKMIEEMGNSSKIALIGIIAPSVVAFPFTYLFDLGFFGWELNMGGRLLVVSSMVATSLTVAGIALNERGLTKTPAGQALIGAGALDDVWGLLKLTLSVNLAVAGTVSLGELGWIGVKAVVFIVVVAGGLFMLNGHLTKYIFSRIDNSRGMKLSMMVLIIWGSGILAGEIGLEPLLGYFVGGLGLDASHYRTMGSHAIVDELVAIKAKLNGNREVVRRIDHQIHELDHRDLEELWEPVRTVFYPLFFILVTIYIDFSVMFDAKVIGMGLLLGLIQVPTKYIAGRGFKGPKEAQSFIGWGMVPRAEVGIAVFDAAIALSIGENPAIAPEITAVMLIAIIVSTFVGPIMIQRKGDALVRLYKQSGETDSNPELVPA